MSEFYAKSLNEDSSSLDPSGDVPGELSQSQLDDERLIGLVSAERDELMSGMNSIITRSQSLLARLNQSSEQSGTGEARGLLRQTLETASYVKVGGEKLYAAALSVVDEENGELYRLTELAQDEVFEQAWSVRWAELRSMILRTFPETVPEVNLSRTPWANADISVPVAAAWQRKMNITDDNVADSLYIGHTADARSWALRSVEALKLDDTPDKETIANYRQQLDPEDDSAAPLNDLLRYYSDLRSLRTVVCGKMERAEVAYYKNGEYGSMWIRYIDPGVVNYANELVQGIDKLLAGGSQQEQFAHFAQLVSESQGSVVRKAAVTMADERCSQLMVEVLSQLSTVLKNAAPVPAQPDNRHLLIPGKKESQGPALVSTTPSDVLVDEYEQLSTIHVPYMILPWLKGEDAERRVLMEVVGTNGRVLVVDGESQAASSVASSSSYDVEYEKNKLEYAAEMIATSRDGRLKNMKHMHGRSKDMYPYPIMYFKQDAANATRLYVAQIPASYLEHIAPKEFEKLRALNVHSILVHIGTCDKANQTTLLSLLTGKSARSVRAQGAGSI